MSRSRSSRAPAALLVLGGLALTGCGGDDEADVTVGAVEVSDAGAADGRVQLPGAAETGATGSSSATVDLAVAIDSGGVDEEIPVTLRLDYDSAVVESDAGGYVVDNEFTAAEVVDAPSGADFSSVDDLVGVRYRETFDEHGSSTGTELLDEGSVTEAQRAAYEEFGSQVSSTTFDYPDEPVGVGATWRAVTTIEQQGFELDVTYHYELTALDGDDYTIAITDDEAIDDSLSLDGTDADVAGRLEGGGTTSGTLGNPLAVASTIEQHLDLDVDADGESVSMTMDIAVDVTPQAA
jgi:hypothetical protein